METTTEQVKRILYFEDKEAIARTTNGAKAVAKALNDVFKHYKFKEPSEIPTDVAAWTLKRTLEVDKKLAALAKVHKLESLKYEVPQWIKDAAASFAQWNSNKSGYTQYLQYVMRVDESNTDPRFESSRAINPFLKNLYSEAFRVDSLKLEELFESSGAYRRYLTGPQLERLELARRWVILLKDSGFKFPDDFQVYGKIYNLPFVKIVNGEIVPSTSFVLHGTRLPATSPMVQSETNVDGSTYIIIR